MSRELMQEAEYTTTTTTTTTMTTNIIFAETVDGYERFAEIV